MKRKRSGSRIALGIIGIILIAIPTFLVLIPYLVPQLIIYGYGAYLIVYPVFDYLFLIMIIVGIILISIAIAKR